MNLSKYFDLTRLEVRALRLREASLIRSRDAYKQKVKVLEETVRSQTKEIEELKELIKTLTKETSDLKELLGKVQETAQKYAGMLFKSNVKKKIERGNENEDEAKTKSRGARIGHTPHHRPTPERIDREVTVHLSHCPDCKTPLEETSSVDERIVEDIPEVKPIVTRYRIERQWCSTCKKEVRAIPKGTVPFCRFGMNILVIVLFLKYRLRTPIAKISEYFSSRYAFSLLPGTIQEMFGSMKKKFSKEYETILTETRNAPVKHADETSFRIEGMNGWCWLFSTPSAAFYTIEETRGKGVPEKILGRSPTELLVRDDYGAYMKLPMAQQSCWAHLLRVAHEKVVLENASEEIKLLHQELKTIFLDLNEKIHEPFEKERREKIFEQYVKSIQAIINRTYERSDAKTIQTRIANQNTRLITALLHEGAPLTNNHAERMIRPTAIVRKISGGSRSNEGAAIQAVNMSIMQTLSLRGKNFLTGVREILESGSQRYGLGRGE